MKLQPAQPFPWQLVINEERDAYGTLLHKYCEGIRDAAGNWVIRFDDDYGTDQWATAKLIVYTMNTVFKA